MNVRHMLDDSLLRRELWSQARRRYPRRGWAYAGPVLFLALTILPLIIYSQIDNQSEHTLMFAFAGVTLAQVLLLLYRATIYCSVSMAYEIRQNTIAVLRSTPLPLLRALGAKLVACLLPLWMELAVLLPFNLVVYSWLGHLPPVVTAGVVPFLWVVSLLCGCFGLWLGSVVPEPERVVGHARVVVTMLWLGTLLLEKLLTWPVLLAFGIVWICIAAQPHTRPGRAYKIGVAALVALLLLPVLYTFAQSRLYGFELSSYNPVYCIYSLTQSHPTPDLMGPELRQAEKESRLTGRSVSSIFVRLSASVPPQEVEFRAIWHLLPTGILYLLAALAFFELTYCRSKLCY